MALQINDYLRIPSGEVGRVVYISKLTVFLAIATRNGSDVVHGYLESQLEKIEAPLDQSSQSEYALRGLSDKKFLATH